jgi:hypothetical protein
MTRSTSPTLLAALALATLGLAAALGAGFARPTSAEDPVRVPHTVYLHVNGEGAQAKAWYDGGPPSGTSVQAALNHFSTLGYRFAAVAPSGMPTFTQVVGTGASIPTAERPREPFFVFLLAR